MQDVCILLLLLFFFPVCVGGTRAVSHNSDGIFFHAFRQLDKNMYCGELLS